MFLCAAAALAKDPPKYKYDSTWPKQLPNNWTFEGITGMFVDRDDHIWVLNRPRDFDKTENFAMPQAASRRNAACRRRPCWSSTPRATYCKSWGGPGYAPGWPRSEHTIFVDKARNVWLARSGCGRYAAEVHQRREIHLRFRPSRPEARRRADGAATEAGQSADGSSAARRRGAPLWTRMPTRFTSPTVTSTGA